MRPQFILILSLVCNLCLAAMAFRYVRIHGEPGKGARTNKSGKTETAESGSNESFQALAQPTTITNFTADEFSWRNVESAEYKDYIANLRAVECPEETVRDIIVADVNKLYAMRSREIRGDDGEYKYWKGNNIWNSSTKEGLERQKRLRELEEEKSALLVELLGVDPNKERNKEMGYEDYRERAVSFLPEEKRIDARKIHEKFQEQRQEIYREGSYEAEDWRKLRQIEKAEWAELSAMLTPDELEQFQLRNSQTANQLRHDLDGFEPTEEEFKTIFRLREARGDDLILSNDQDDKETHERRQKTSEEIDALVKTQLGDQRYEEYKRAQDYSYKELTRLTERLELPKGTAVAVYDMKESAEDAVKKVREDKTLTSEQRTQALQAIRSETEKAITEALGESGFKKYKTRGGWWISNLAPTVRSSHSTTIVR